VGLIRQQQVDRGEEKVRDRLPGAARAGEVEELGILGDRLGESRVEWRGPAAFVLGKASKGGG
jgi:hypothetical protein